MKKIFAFLCATALLLSVPFTASAVVTVDYSEEQAIAEEVLSTFGSYAVEECVELYDTGGEVEAICFNFYPQGYVIVNVNDYSIPEFSPEAVTPFPNSDCHYVYVGPLNYYLCDSNGSLTNIKTEKTGTVDQLNYEYNVLPDNEEKNISKVRASESVTRASLSFITRNLPAAWSSSYYCGLDGCAIELKYLDQYHDTTLLNANMDSNLELQEYLLDNKYIPNSGTTADEIVNGTFINYKGINKFFEDRGSSIRASWSRYSNSVLVEMQESFDADYPVILGTDPADDWDYGDHWVIAYGYFYQDLSGAHIIVNDGFGTNNIYLTIEDDHYDDAIFFNN